MPRRRSARARRLAAGVAAALLLAMATAAWACVPQPLISMKPKASGPPGTKVEVVGVAFPGTAELRWNAIDGELLGKIPGPDFTLEITIPEAPDGLYSLIGVARSGAGAVAATGSASFEITGPEGPAAASAAASTDPPASKTGERSSSGPPALALAGVGLALGALGGVAVGRRRSPARRP